MMKGRHEGKEEGPWRVREMRRRRSEMKMSEALNDNLLISESN